MYKLLTKRDIENIKEYNKCNNAIDMLVESEREKIEEDVFKQAKSKGFNEQEMNESGATLEILRYEYRSNDKGIELLIIGIIFSPMILLFDNATQNKLLIPVIAMIGLWLLINGIKQINTRRKIKNNFKEMGVKY